MARTAKIPLGGLNTELYAHRLPEAAADKMVNTILEGGDLRSRQGFALFESDVDGAGGAVLNVWTAHFADGAVYVVAKIGAKFWQRQVYPTDAGDGSFAQITTGHTHSATDRGWSYMWDDFLFLCDSGGVSKWNPDKNAGTAYKAGLTRPSTGPLTAQAGDGEKVGRYHVAWAIANSRTGEIGPISSQQTPAVLCNLEDPDNKSGISITNWATLKALHSDYEWDQAFFYTSQGSTEWDTQGLEAEKFSFRLMLDAIVGISAGSVGLNKADSVLDPRTLFTNAGGEPPGASKGVYDGLQAVYVDGVSGTAAAVTTAVAGANNDITYTAAFDGPDGNAITIAYTVGGTAGSEVVTVVGTAVSVKTEDGVSTATQVLAAVVASGPANSLVTAALAQALGSGTVTTMTAVSLTGGSLTGGTASPGRVDYSLPNNPASVPARERYALGGDATTVTPRPWEGRITTGTVGKLVNVVAGANRIWLLTPTSIIELIRGQDYRLNPTLRHPTVGCAGEAASAGGPNGATVLGYESLMRLTPAGMRDLAAYRVRPTIREIPATARDDSVMALYSFLRQTWVAITRPGGTVPMRILIYDEDAQEFWTFDIACLGTRATLTTALATGTNNNVTYTAEAPGAEGNAVTVAYVVDGSAGEEYVSVSSTAITVHVAAATTAATVVDVFNSQGDSVALATSAVKAGEDGSGAVIVMGASSLAGGTGDEGIKAMVELAVPNAGPTMLVATDAGRILQYPDGTTDATVGYAARWRGYFGQSRAQLARHLDNLAVCPDDTTAGTLRVGVRSMQMSDESGRRQNGRILHKDQRRTPMQVDLNPTHGRVFQAEFFTPHSVTTRWSVRDLHNKITQE